MHRRQILLGLVGVWGGGFILDRPAHADSVNVGVSTDDFQMGIQIGSPPPMVVVPGTTVYHAPSVPHDYFWYGGRYYVLHEGAWYYSQGYNGPWMAIAVHQVPQSIIVVPTHYYKIPPGHMKKEPHHARHEERRNEEHQYSHHEEHKKKKK